MMLNKDLLRHVTDMISNRSRYYKAEITTQKRLYHPLSGMVASPLMSYGIDITRYTEPYGIPRRAFIFEPDIIRYVNREARLDSGFSQRLRNLELDSDDIEAMVRKLTYGRIRLFMRGRKRFVEDADDDL